MRSESLTDEQVSEQALALHSYVYRGGEKELWLASKGFTERDKRLILAEYLKRLRSTGEVSA